MKINHFQKKSGYALHAAGYMFFAAILFLPKIAAAFTLPPLIPAACTGAGSATGACGLPELIQVGINLARIILALSGSLALLMFIYGGFTWLTAAGSNERVEKGRKILIGAVIGLIIIFGAVTIVNFAQQALTTPAAQNQQQ